MWTISNLVPHVKTPSLGSSSRPLRYTFLTSLYKSWGSFWSTVIPPDLQSASCTSSCKTNKRLLNGSRKPETDLSFPLPQLLSLTCRGVSLEKHLVISQLSKITVEWKREILTEEFPSIVLPRLKLITFIKHYRSANVMHC